MCSEAMVWGMTDDKFWHCSWATYFCYMRKYQIELNNVCKKFDVQSWIQGKYVRDALLDVYYMFNGLVDVKKAKKYPYPTSPNFENEKKPKSSKSRKKKDNKYLLAIQEHNLMIQAKKMQKCASNAPLE